MAQPPPLPVKTTAPKGTGSGAREWKYLSPDELRSLKNLLFAARLIVEGAYAGRHKSPYKGSAAEFVDYREYYPGDEIRSIDWKAYARTDRYFVKLFERETDLNCHILVDRSASMGYGGKEFNAFFPTKELSKLEYASYLAAALAYVMIKQGDRVSLTLFDEKVNAHVAPGSTFPHLYSILNVLEKQRPGRKTSVSQVLRDAYALHRRRGLLVLVSDLLDEPESIFQALDMYRHRRFEIILFHVLHRYEVDLPPLDSVNFIDAETGESVTSRPGDISKAYRNQLNAFIGVMASSARARNIDYNLVNTTTPYHDVLQKYLLRRSTL
ncbi:MAG: DUF58 domain-containing protein [Candidatus Hydrogenedentes bacterium]|nr:DUF58 domain-containing protein [Candidatus Hydrogenedentota bacterium]